MKQFLFGLFMLAIGLSIALKTGSYLNNFGRMSWAEEHLSGRSRQGYKVIAVIFIVLGIMGITGLFGGFATGLLTKIFVR